MPLITVLTPTYNRACLLPRLYDSLVAFRIRGALMANVYARFLNIKPKKNFLVALMYLPAFMVYKIWKWKYKMENE